MHLGQCGGRDQEHEPSLWLLREGAYKGGQACLGLTTLRDFRGSCDAGAVTSCLISGPRVIRSGLQLRKLNRGGDWGVGSGLTGLSEKHAQEETGEVARQSKKVEASRLTCHPTHVHHSVLYYVCFRGCKHS